MASVILQADLDSPMANDPHKIRAVALTMALHSNYSIKSVISVLGTSISSLPAIIYKKWPWMMNPVSIVCHGGKTAHQPLTSMILLDPWPVEISGFITPYFL